MKEQKNGERENKDERNVQNGHTNTYLKNSLASKQFFFKCNFIKNPSFVLICIDTYSLTRITFKSSWILLKFHLTL